MLVSHEPGVLDALELAEGLRAGGTDEPLIVLGTAPSAEMTSLCFEVGADAYCCVAETTTRSLLWTFARAIERFQLVRENRRLLQMDRQRLALEHQEAGDCWPSNAPWWPSWRENGTSTSRRRNSTRRVADEYVKGGFSGLSR